ALSPSAKVHSDPTFLAALERMHALKTGALIRAAVRMGAVAAGIEHPRVAQLDRYASALGLAFQIQDDILDVEGDSHSLGKTAGKDAAQDKLTYPALLGLDGAKTRLQALAATMHEALSEFDTGADALRALAALTVQRRH
ncbi:MAG TPA: polyprenyl synthetase family protein, partial [Arenimonas sp.]|nr:polyprenyl synthetase family protein [Arenimonas sp.]